MKFWQREDTSRCQRLGFDQSATGFKLRDQQTDWISYRLTTQLDGEHHITIPNHAPLRLGTFKGILKLLAAHHDLTVEDLLEKLEL
jgi:hypothetical protein